MKRRRNRHDQACDDKLAQYLEEWMDEYLPEIMLEAEACGQSWYTIDVLRVMQDKLEQQMRSLNSSVH